LAQLHISTTVERWSFLIEKGPAEISHGEPRKEIMNSDSKENQSAKLLPCDASRYTGVAQATLAKMRCWGGGPEYLKLGRKVVYEREALDAWLNERRARNTSDAARLPRRMAQESCGEAR
jgi:hypothetical protein